MISKMGSFRKFTVVCVLGVVVALACAPLSGTTAMAADSSASEISSAVLAMRGIKVESLSEAQKRTISETLDKAWKTLTDAGAAGSAAIKEELKKLDASKEQDDFFKLGACALLWQIGKLDEAGAIGSVWSGNVDLSSNYQYVFFTAFDAARTRDPRALPMLIAVLRDQKGSAFVPQHSLDIEWPLSHLSVWGVFGSQGVPALIRVLDESKDETTLASAVVLLAMTKDIRALEKIRVLAHTGAGAARREAIKALGSYGHPLDFDFLLAGLKDKTRDPWAFAFALYEYGDLRAVPDLIPLLSEKDERLRNEALSCLAHLVTPKGLDALYQCAEMKDGGKFSDMCKTVLGNMLKSCSLTFEAYAAKTPEQRTEIAASIRKSMEEKYRLRPDDRKLTHAEFKKAAAEWIAKNRITGGTYQWVEDRHVLSVATAADIPLLLDVQASCFVRLSDECLYEIQTLQELVHRLGRSQFRKEVGVCDKVEPLTNQK